MNMDGVGWCTHDESHQLYTYVIAHGFPQWSREGKSSSAGGPVKIPRLTSGGGLHSSSAPSDDEVEAPVRGTSSSSPVVGTPASGSLSSVVVEDWPGQPSSSDARLAAELCGWMQDFGTYHEDDESTHRGSSRPGSPTSSWVDAGALPLLPPCAVQLPSGSQLVPPGSSAVIQLSELDASQLAEHLGALALLDAGPPPSSPRLKAVLIEQGVRALDCPAGHPGTTAAAAFCLDEDAFGSKVLTQAVVLSCMARWNIIASSESRARAVPVSLLVSEQAQHRDRALGLRQPDTAARAEAEEATALREAVRAVPDATHTVQIRAASLLHWLARHVRHEDWVVCKMDIENVEHRVLPELLAAPSTLRLIDELFVECHHVETYGVPPHRYAECLTLYERLAAAGVWVHDYF